MIIEEKKQIEKYTKYGLPYQPQLFKVGCDDKPSFYLKFNDVSWKFSNLLKALDICFKTYQVLNLEYPFETALLWTFIQNRIYNIKTKFDIKTPSLIAAVSGTF